MNQTFTRVTSQIDTLAMALATINTLATGGVCWPMPRLTVTINPKCTGSIPAALTSGITTGTTRMIAAAECRNMPSNRNNRLSSASTAHLFCVSCVTACASCCGACTSVRYVPRSALVATSSMTTAVCTAPSITACRSCATSSSR